MLAKKTSKNQITLPKEIVTRFPGVDYFDVVAQGEQIVLIPLRPSRAGEVRAKLEALGIDDSDLRQAVESARRR